MKVIEWELSNTCACESYDENTDTSKPAEYCDGYCYEDEVDNITTEILEPWVKVKGWEMDSHIRVQGSAMGWRRLNGYTDTRPKNLIESLGINGDYTLRFKFDGKDLIVIRSSHDEPTGATFEFELSPHDEAEVR